MKALLAVAALALTASPVMAQQSQHMMVNAKDLQWKAAKSPGFNSSFTES